ncbi:MAG: ABC transporter ATP-binding protein [Lachnospiraceae bacterium]|nr:ABC transporter ATP-binding protein [Lachnospiraceae bacterium]
MNILEVENLSITYDREKSAVDHVSFSVPDHSIICLVGESGSGKSTVLHGIMGLLPRSALVKGKVTLFGQDMIKAKKSRLNQMRGKDIAVIFQDTGRYMNPISTIGAQYREFLRQHGKYSKQECRDLAAEVLRRVHLQEPERVLDSYPFELSGGMRQRVGIAMAITLNPKILFADEPTSALDVTVQAQVIRQMMNLRTKYGTSIIMVTHNMGVAAYMADYIGVMQNGKLVEWGTAPEVIHNPKQEYTRNLLAAIVEMDDERLILSCG